MTTTMLIWELRRWTFYCLRVCVIDVRDFLHHCGAAFSCRQQQQGYTVSLSLSLDCRPSFMWKTWPNTCSSSYTSSPSTPLALDSLTVCSVDSPFGSAVACPPSLAVMKSLKGVLSVSHTHTGIIVVIDIRVYVLAIFSSAAFG